MMVVAVIVVVEVVMVSKNGNDVWGYLYSVVGDDRGRQRADEPVSCGVLNGGGGI